MTLVSIVGPQAGEIMLGGAVTMRILEDGSTTGHRLGIGEITVAPHTDGPPQHRHARHDEGFYVVSGTARFTVGSDVHDAPAGSLVMVPPGAPHTFANPGDEPAVLLNTFTPDLYVQYFRDLRAMVEGGTPMTPDSVAGVMARYATTPSTEYTPAYDDRGTGRPVMVLHGGGGPASVLGLSAALAADHRVLTPTIPGFEGTPRPDDCRTVADVARRYLDLLVERDLHDVVVVGSSVGGWIAAEMALQSGADGPVGGIVLVNAVGIEVPDHPVTDISGLPLDRIADFSYADPDRFRIDPTTLPAARQEAMAANAAVFADYAGDPYMLDPTLLGRLPAVTVPAAVVWGEADGIVDVAYGRAYAEALGAPFTLVEGAGHLPHVEQPERTVAAVEVFLGASVPTSTAR
ncbi:alpha/beta fold hydrolase [Actinomycetospora sp. TBRC 11914]|uniref:alpha/beta fold hydrolase n=1 Tax=Actinomycetospora sp. TBRC 11914 TaxID=2729387 RepID=UPI00145F19C3|nr:alpha/beta fold hydrolase [Actinomycetospora sp. TBRC 11914]NMO93046.1 alpha/beta fold hydrolase [Actinomycetospora sp. TBRC 11914]